MNRSGKRAFSLVEMAIALGIFSFAILAILGLLSISITSSRESSEDTCSAAIITQTIDALRAKPFAALASGTTELYFDREGSPQSKTQSTPSSFKCTVEKISASDSEIKLTLTITFPSGATKTTYASIACYQ